MPRRKDARACGVFMFGADWRAEPTLMLCSEGARLLWFEMLLLMAESERRGFLLINGRRPSAAQIATLTRTDPAKVRERLEELESNGVFSRDGAGAIYSRRMVRDLKNRENGARGGNPNLCRAKGNQERDNPNAEIGLTRSGAESAEKRPNGATANSLQPTGNPPSVKPLTPSSIPSPNGDGGGPAAATPERDLQEEPAVAEAAEKGDLEGDLFRRGKPMLGRKSGGMIADAIKRVGHEGTYAILLRMQRGPPENPREFFAKAVSERAADGTGQRGRWWGDRRGDEAAKVASLERHRIRRLQEEVEQTVAADGFNIYDQPGMAEVGRRMTEIIAREARPAPSSSARAAAHA